MDINKLKTFIDLAHTLSFSTTAANLYTEQSTVSKHINSLEKELGMSLFDRNNRHVHLSDYGEKILPWAQQIVELNDQIVSEAQKVRDDQNSTINIGVIPTFADYPSFSQLMTYQKQQPAMNVQLHEMETASLMDQLDKGAIDLAFARSLKAKLGNYDQLVVDQEDFTVALPTDHPLSHRKIIQLADLKNEKFIMLAKNSLLYNPVLALCHKAGFDPQIVFTSDRISTILKMVGDHQGIAILMHHPGQQNNVLFKKLKPTRTSYLMFLRQKKTYSKNLNQLWHYLQQAKQ